MFWLVMLAGLVAGCIKPVNEGELTLTPGSTPQGIVTPINSSNGGGITPIAPTGVSADLLVIQGFLQSYGAQPTPGSLTLWRIAAFESDLILGVNFGNPSGLPCIAVGLGSRDAAGNLSIFTGGFHCASEPGSPAVVGQWTLATSTNKTLTIIAGLVVAPDVQRVAIVFANAPQYEETLQNRNFMVLRTDFIFATMVNISNIYGNLVGQPPVPLNPQG
jgi:hypothetical protein